MHNYACRNELARGFKPAGTLPPLGELEGASLPPLGELEGALFFSFFLAQFKYFLYLCSCKQLTLCKTT